MANKQSTDGKIRELALFAGAGGGILGGIMLGWETVCAVEKDPYAASVLLARQNDGILPPFPIWDDVCTFDGKPWRGIVDVVSGGFPCQDISVAGAGNGIDGERSGLWREMARIIGEVRPKIVFVENSPALTIRGGTRVIADLASLGYVGRWGVMGGNVANNVCKGERIWIVATNGAMLEGVDIKQHYITNTSQSRRRQFARAVRETISQDDYSRIKRNPNVVAAQMDRLKAVGNGQVPTVAATAFRILSGVKPRSTGK